MLQYFQDYYLHRRYGGSYILTEVLIVFVGVLLLSDLTFVRNGRLQIKRILFFVLKFCGSFLAVLFAESLLYALPNGNPHALDVVYPLFLLLFALICSDLKRTTRLAVAPLFYALVLLTMGLSENIGYFLRLSWGWNGFTSVIQCLAMLLISVLLKVFSTENFSYISVWYAIFILAVSAITIAVYYIVSPAILERTITIAVFFGYFFLDLLAYLIFWLMGREHNKRIAAEIIQEKQENDEKFMRATQESYEKLCAMRHDIKNQYAAMSALLEEGKYEQLRHYFGQYFKEYEEELGRSNCGNNVLDNLINIETSKARGFGISIVSEVAVPPVLPFADADLCSVITNLLDNAIEAVCLLEEDEADGKASTIRLSINSRQEYLFIRVVNACSGLESGEYAGLHTTKEDASLHGYGTKIVQRIARKYQGSVRYCVQEGEFIADVMLSMHISDEHAHPKEG